jgi:sulfatase maturation enzyme AslB (radical SAM superfamily)
VSNRLSNVRQRMFKPCPRLEITTVNNCSINCSYCPQQAFKEHYSGCNTLQLEDFKKALSKVPKNVEIHFSGFSEPFLNAHCIEMLEYAHLKGYKVFLFSTLVGLKSSDVKRLQRCSPKLTLHLPDKLGNAKIPVTKTYKDTLNAVLTQLPIDTFYRMDECFISNERAGLCSNTTKRQINGCIFCEKLFVPQFVMLPNCDVVLCCMDYELKHPLGNLLSESWLELVKSSEYQKVIANRFIASDDILCCRCAWASLGFRQRYYIKRIVQRYHAKKLLQLYFRGSC